VLLLCYNRCGHGDIVLFKDNSKKEVGRQVGEQVYVSKRAHVPEAVIKIHYREGDIDKREGILVYVCNGYNVYVCVRVCMCVYVCVCVCVSVFVFLGVVYSFDGLAFILSLSLSLSLSHHYTINIKQLRVRRRLKKPQQLLSALAQRISNVATSH